MDKYVGVNSALRVLMVICNLGECVSASQEQIDVSAATSDVAYPFTHMKYKDALAQLHGHCSNKKIFELVSQQAGKDPITEESICRYQADEFVVLPDKRYVLSMRTVVKLILSGHSFNPFTRAPFSDEFCEALSTMVSINCTNRTILEDETAPRGEPRPWFLLELCSFYIAQQHQEALIQPDILLLQINERERVCNEVNDTLIDANAILDAAEKDDDALKELLQHVIAAAQFHNGPCGYQVCAEQMLGQLRAGVEIYEDIADMIRNYWIMPLQRAHAHLQDQDGLINYGMQYESRLRDREGPRGTGD